MQKYELLLVLPGTLDDKEVEVKAAEVLSLVKEFGDEAELHVMGKNRLAYPIKQIRYGYFYTVTFKSEAEKAEQLLEKLRIHREILRFMVSHFNTNLTAQQKIAYTTETSGVTRMVEKEPTAEIHIPRSKVPAKETPAPAEATPAPTEKLDLEEINKKLDDLMGDVIPGI